MWWVNGFKAPPLLTTNDLLTGPGGQRLATLGTPGTRVLLGGGDLLDDRADGLRVGFGWWLDPCHCHGFDGSVFFLGTRSANYEFNNFSPGVSNQILERPFTAYQSLNPPGVLLPSSELIGSPGALVGFANVNAVSDLWGADINYRRNWRSSCLARCDWLVGFRYLDLNERLEVTEAALGVPGGPFSGMQIRLSESIKTGNQFFGPQLGFMAECRRGPWTLDLRAKVGLGVTWQSITYSGATTMASNGTVMTLPGGLYALNSNIGTFNRDRFSVVPELSINLGYNLTERLRVFVGYNLLYWSNVVRPGDQVDFLVDEARVPFFNPTGVAPLPGGRPGVPFRETDLWAQGLNFGLHWTW
jgi:hypothetical protein